jgi:predicted ATP-dependent serine protease
MGSKEIFDDVPAQVSPGAMLQAAREARGLSALDVAHLMILLKIARAVYTPTRDSYVDIAGYARCAAQIAGFEEE